MTTLYSWNVNGIRALQRKGFLDWLAETKPDILGLQETKAHPDQLDEAMLNPEGYHAYFASAERKGYSGVALYTRKEPNSVSYGLGFPEFDKEGRTLIAEYDDFVFITAYFPNGQNDHARVPYKMEYKRVFLEYCNQLRAAGKSVIFCGDVNTAHQEIDLARPKSNKNTTGFLTLEREWIDEIVKQGYIDTYRHAYPEQEGAYTWWSLRGSARTDNVGWRIDYFFISPDLKDQVHEAAIHHTTLGSDHCPISLTLK